MNQCFDINERIVLEGETNIWIITVVIVVTTGHGNLRKNNRNILIMLQCRISQNHFHMSST